MRVIAPEQFISRPWKNGKGRTLELAINEGGAPGDFDWRISIAQVAVDGPFSDFCGHDRYLFLLEGAGMDLLHDDGSSHSLSAPLDLAQFDGGSHTVATLHGGPITDFNLMTRRGRSRVWTRTCRTRQRIVLPQASRHLLFSPRHPMQVRGRDNQVLAEVPVGHLLVSGEANDADRAVEGAHMIIIGLTDLG